MSKMKHEKLKEKIQKCPDCGESKNGDFFITGKTAFGVVYDCYSCGNIGDIFFNEYRRDDSDE